MRFGYQSIIYGPRFESASELDRALAFISDSGFSGVELFQEPDEFRRLGLNCQQLVEKLARFGLSMLGMSGADLKARREFLGDYKSPYLYTDIFPIEEVQKTLLAGYRVALHPHAFKPIHNVEDALRWFRDPRFQKYWQGGTKQLLLLPDTAHSKIVWDRDDRCDSGIP